MVYKPTVDTAQHALDETQQLAANKQYSWGSGLNVSLSPATSIIETELSSGTVVMDGETISIGNITVEHSDGDPDYPRWDAVCVSDRSGTVEAISGIPAKPVTTPDGNVIRGEGAFKPAPSDDITNEMVCLALVWIPSGATVNDDLKDTSNGGVPNPIRDRRVKQAGRIDQFTHRSEIQSSGWHRIAAMGPLDTSGDSGEERASALFTVRDTQAGKHSSLTFYASCIYGQNPALTVLNSSSTVNDRAIQDIRLIDGGGNDGAAVDVNVQLGGASSINHVEYTIQNNYHEDGWSPEGWQSASVPSGFEVTQIDVSSNPLFAGARENNTPWYVDGDGVVHAQDINRANVGSRAWSGVDQDIPSGTQRRVEFNTISYDNRGEFNTDIGRFVPNQQGMYRVNSTLQWSINNPDQAEVGSFIVINGSQHAGTFYQTSGPERFSTSVSDTMPLAAGDTVEIHTQQTTGSSMTINGARHRTWVTITRVG
jgi:hypothetical protein